MAKRKYTKRSSKKNNSFMIFFIIIIVLALLSFLISYFVTQTEREAVGDEIKTEEVTNKETPSNNQESINTILEGTWASYNDGAMLTIKGNKFTIELPSVESSIAASGSLIIVGKVVTFVYSNKDSSCGDKPGVYEFIFDSDDEITLKKINDDCVSRSNQLIASWFRV